MPAKREFASAFLQIAEFDGEGKIAVKRVSRSVDDYLDNCRCRATVAQFCNELKQCRPDRLS
jgi:hypothetical protein